MRTARLRQPETEDELKAAQRSRRPKFRASDNRLRLCTRDFWREMNSDADLCRLARLYRVIPSLSEQSWHGREFSAELTSKDEVGRPVTVQVYVHG